LGLLQSPTPRNEFQNSNEKLNIHELVYISLCQNMAYSFAIYNFTYDYLGKSNLWLLSLIIFLIVVIYVICHVISMTTFKKDDDFYDRLKNVIK